MKKIPLIMITIPIIYFVLITTAYADFGPKPSITIKAKNMPDTICYMDLLTKDFYTFRSEGYVGDSRYNQQMVEKLKSYYDKGWKSAIVNGYTPIQSGDILCEIKNGECTLNYGYMVPEQFKIIVVTEKGDIVVSNIIARRAFNSIIYFDFKSTEAIEGPILISYALQFSGTCLATIIIEGFVLLLFRFRLKENLKPFLIINIITQVLLAIVVFYGMDTIGVLGALLFYFLFEIFILIFEIIMFVKYLKQHSKIRRAMFALAANILSFFAGVLMMLLFI